MDQQNITVTEAQQGLRLDKALAALLPAMSRSRLQQLISQGQLQLADQPITDNKRKVSAGEVYTLIIPPLVDATPVAQDIPLDIVYEDADLLVINKPVGLTVHPGAGNANGTMVNALLHHCRGSLSGIGGVERPGIVHRIDKDTSGLLIVAKHDAAHQALAAQLEDRSLSRTYQALVWGLPNPSSGTIEATIGRDPRNRQRMAIIEGGAEPSLSGKHAVTHFQVLEAFGTLISLVECKLETGRTHQIRVHMKHIGHSLVGDQTYGSRKTAQLQHADKAVVDGIRGFLRQALHAQAIAFIHPSSGERMRFECPLPDDMQALMALIRV